MNTPTILHVSADGLLSCGTFSCRAALGKGGVIQDKCEGDGATPIGSFPLRACLYRPDRVEMPETGLPCYAITPAMGWCDDPALPEYNRMVALPFSGSLELLWREDHRYDIIVVLGHNDAPPEPGKGSAIFFHLAEDDYPPTEGCVAVSLKDMQHILKSLTPDSVMTIGI